MKYSNGEVDFDSGTVKVSIDNKEIKSLWDTLQKECGFKPEVVYVIPDSHYQLVLSLKGEGDKYEITPSFPPYMTPVEYHKGRKILEFFEYAGLLASKEEIGIFRDERGKEYYVGKVCFGKNTLSSNELSNYLYILCDFPRKPEEIRAEDGKIRVKQIYKPLSQSQVLQRVLEFFVGKNPHYYHTCIEVKNSEDRKLLEDIVAVLHERGILKGEPKKGKRGSEEEVKDIYDRVLLGKGIGNFDRWWNGATIALTLGLYGYLSSKFGSVPDEFAVKLPLEYLSIVLASEAITRIGEKVGGEDNEIVKVAKTVRDVSTSPAYQNIILFPVAAGFAIVKWLRERKKRKEREEVEKMLKDIDIDEGCIPTYYKK